MTSGLFNTGVAGVSSEITSHTPSAAQPSTSMSTKVIGHDDFLMETFDTDFDMDLFGDLGGAGFDPLADASLDSFTDLSALLSEQNTFLDPSEDGEAEPLPDFSRDITPCSSSLKRSFDEMEAGSSDLNNPTARIGLATTSNHDHAYSSKRPRMSAVTEEPPSAEKEGFLAPAPLPPPTPSTSTSYVITSPPEDKSRSRREKNNIASRRSREIRKQKFATMETEADHLIAENARLERRVAELEGLAKRMKEILVAKMAGK